MARGEQREDFEIFEWSSGSTLRWTLVPTIPAWQRSESPVPRVASLSCISPSFRLVRDEMALLPDDDRE